MSIFSEDKNHVLHSIQYEYCYPQDGQKQEEGWKEKTMGEGACGEFKGFCFVVNILIFTI